MWRCVAIPQKLNKTVFFEVFFFLRLWRCGDMWRYMVIPENRKICYLFCIFLVVALWRYVAICGDTQKNNVLFKVFF